MAATHSMSLMPTYRYGEKTEAQEPVYGDGKVCTRRGFFGRGKLQPLSQNDRCTFFLFADRVGVLEEGIFRSPAAPPPVIPSRCSALHRHHAVIQSLQGRSPWSVGKRSVESWVEASIVLDNGDNFAVMPCPAVG